LLVLPLLIIYTGEGPMIPAVMRAVVRVVGPVALGMVLLAALAHRTLGWRGFSAGVLVGLLFSTLAAGLCVPMLE
jgi:hypothetical protein